MQSSLILALLRCILTDGAVYYDGLDTQTINLDALRSNVTIIPQIVSGSRYSLMIYDLTENTARATQRFTPTQLGSFRRI